jgi:hypothetical protein
MLKAFAYLNQNTNNKKPEYLKLKRWTGKIATGLFKANTLDLGRLGWTKEWEKDAFRQTKEIRWGCQQYPKNVHMNISNKKNKRVIKNENHVTTEMDCMHTA